jgi:alkanesulfonate monooxygenase SsuD/methylene tetrahydromethanopterin reductase-like flavin-dependent oxidoreductase (luciferase family)
MLGFNVFAADTDEEARLLATSMQQAFVNLRSGRPTPLLPPSEGYESRLSPPERAIIEQTLSCSAIGSRERVQRELQAFIARTGADELMITSQIHDHRKRLHSYRITAEIHDALADDPQA